MLLTDWIKANPKYNGEMNEMMNGAKRKSTDKKMPSILTQKIVSSFMTRELHQETIDLFLNAARSNHEGILV